MKHAQIFIIFLVVCSCSSNNIKIDKKIQTGLAVPIATGVETSIGGPNFYVFTTDKVKNTSRSIASTEPSVEISDRKLYLYNLLVQHNIFKRSLGFNKDVNICPQFHNDLISDKESLKFSNYKINLERSFLSLSEEDFVYYPELALTHNDKPLYSYVGDTFLTEKFKTAMLKKAESNYHEIQEICEKGNSDGFFIYTNLIRHIQSNPSYLKDEETYKAIFKVPAVANMLILKGGANDNGYGNYHPVESELLSRLNAHWLRNYIAQINSFRKSKVSFRRVD